MDVLRWVFILLEVEQNGLDFTHQEYGVPVLSYFRVAGHTLNLGSNYFAALTHYEGVHLMHPVLNYVLILTYAIIFSQNIDW